MQLTPCRWYPPLTQSLTCPHDTSLAVAWYLPLVFSTDQSLCVGQLVSSHAQHRWTLPSAACLVSLSTLCRYLSCSCAGTPTTLTTICLEYVWGCRQRRRRPRKEQTWWMQRASA